MRRRVWAAVCVALFFAGGVIGAVRAVRGVEGAGVYFSLPDVISQDDRAIAEVWRSSLALQEKADATVAYFVQHAVRYASRDGARIFYPGAMAYHGARVGGLEGFARTGVIFAAWLYGGRRASVVGVDLVAFLKRGLLIGTDPQNSAYWGDMTDYDQRIVEAADIARIVWLTRALIWESLSEGERGRVIAWLDQVNQRRPVDNNWRLFPLTVNAVLLSLDQSRGRDPSEAWQAYKKDYARTSGWFFDPPEGIDFYNSWAISYELFWLHYILPSLDPDYLAQALKNSAFLTAHLISPKGLPMMGRSVCYRAAVPVSVLAQAVGEVGKQGLARRAFEVVWQYFAGAGALREGAFTQGYRATDLSLLDNYSGPGSCQWSARSLVLALLMRPEAAFWRGEADPLPVEEGAFDLSYPELGWRIVGDPGSQDITIWIEGQHGYPALRPYRLTDRLLEAVLARPCRPQNHEAKYRRESYSVLRPFFPF